MLEKDYNSIITFEFKEEFSLHEPIVEIFNNKTLKKKIYKKNKRIIKKKSTEIKSKTDEKNYKKKKNDQIKKKKY